MNILRHKSWHVRTQTNMDRVRRDEAKAAEKEKQILDRQIQAENERRINSLRQRAEDKMTKMFGVSSSSANELNSRKDMSISDETGHVNLFQDLEREERKNLGTGNKEYEADKAAEKREYESKMGIQVYFADNTNDLDKKKEWYEKLPNRGRKFEKPKEKEDFLAARAKLEKEMEEKRISRKRKQSESDSEDDRKRRKKAKKEHKKSKKKDKDRKKKKKKRSRDSSEERMIDEKYEIEKKRRLAEMRDERLKRERVEAARTYALLHPQAKKEENEKGGSKKPKYNSQFNPDFFKD